MKRIAAIFSILMILGLLFSCGTTQNTTSEPAKADYPKVTQLDAMPGPAPTFISKPQLYVEKDATTGEMIMYIWLMDRGADLNGTKQVIKAAAFQRIAEGIKLLINSQLSYAMSGDKNTTDEYIESAVAAVAKNVKVTGFMQAMEWWRLMSYQESKDAKIEKYYEVYLLFRMPYDEYKRARDEALKSFYSNTPPANQELVDTAKKNLEELDEEATMMEWSNNF